MQSQVMKNVRMISPQETEVASMMEGMIKVVAEYRNTNNAIGYTFRYYATQMNADKNIKLLAINGIHRRRKTFATANMRTSSMHLW